MPKFSVPESTEGPPESKKLVMPLAMSSKMPLSSGDVPLPPTVLTFTVGFAVVAVVVVVTFSDDFNVVRFVVPLSFRRTGRSKVFSRVS